MKMLMLLPLAIVATPALAQHYPPPPPSYDEARDDQARPPIDPRTALAVAGAVRAVTDAILDVRIDGVTRAAGGGDDGARTVGDLMARRDPYYREHIHQDMTRAARTAAGAARTAGAVQAAADEFARRIEDAIAHAGG